MPVANASPATSLRSAWGRDAALVLLLAGCGGSSTTLPPEIHLTVAPTTLSLVAGATATLTATLTGSTGSLAWSSSATSIATVDQSGLVTAVSAGTATITVALSGQGGVTATCTVTVTAPPTSVAVSAITQGGQAVNLANVKGTLTVALDVNLPSGASGTVEAYLGDKLVGSTEVPAVSGSPAQEASLRMMRQVSVDVTTQVTTLTSDMLAVETPNGAYDLLAKLKVGGVVAATSATTPVTVTNNTAVVIRGTPMGPSVTLPGTNQVIYGGDFQLDAFEARFNPLQVLEHVDLTLDLAVPSDRGHISPVYGADFAGGAVHLLLKHDQEPNAGGTLGIGEGTWAVKTATVTTSSQTFAADILNNLTGQSLPTNSFGLDYTGPELPSGFTLKPGAATAWINSSTDIKALVNANGFTWTGTNATVKDLSAPVTCTFNAGVNPNSPTYVDVHLGSDLGPETATATLGMKVICTDALGHSSSALLENGNQHFGVDNTAPTIRFLSTLNNVPGIAYHAVNPAAGTPVYLSGTEQPSGGGSGSGIDPQGYSIKTLLHATGVSGQSSCLYGTWNDGTGCLPNLRLNATYTPAAPPVDGEVEVQAGATDFAGNASAVKSFWYTVDHADPTVSGFTGTFLHPGDNAYDLSFHIADNVRVAKAAVAIQYDGYPHGIVFGNTEVSRRFNPTLTSSYDYQLHFDALPTALEQSSLQGNGYYYPNGVKRLATNIVYGGADGAERSIANLWSLSTAFPAHDRFASFRVGSTGMDRIDIGGPYAICSNPYGAHGDCQGIPTSFQAWVDTYFHAGGVNPVQQAYFGKITTFGGQSLAVLSATAATAMMTDYGSYFVNHYTYTFDDCDLPAGVYDVGFWFLDGSGNIFATRTATMTVTLAVKF